MDLKELLYPLGFVSSILFSLRFFHQWITSERKKKSHVTRTFWLLSLFGNGALAIHAFIQRQFPIFLIQVVNATISWRNLNLMSGRPWPFKRILKLLMASSLVACTLFFMQGSSWMRSPTLFWSDRKAFAVDISWHLFGLLGLLLFTSRFWIQWWHAEREQTSFLGKEFWWFSLIGGVISVCYFIRLFDPVNILGYGTGLIPYVRNLFLIKKEKRPFDKSLFIFAGEKSGDILGGHLITALKKKGITLRFFGVGGEKMQEAGLQTLLSTSAFCVMGFTDVFKAFPRLIKQFYRVKKYILTHNPQGVVLIDYPDFNLRLAKALRHGGYQGKIIQYVCPTVWAWRKGRIKTLEKYYDLVLSILPFEKKHFEKTSLNVVYVGHPLIKSIKEAHFYPIEQSNFPTPIVALFPGSRHHEITHNLPDQLATFLVFQKEHKTAACVISVASRDLKEAIQNLALKYQLTLGKDLFFFPGSYRFEMMELADVALATSGTITFELALKKTPTVVCYKLSKLNYVLARYLFRIRVPYISIANLICDKELLPEFVGTKLSVKNMAQALAKMMGESSFDEFEKQLTHNDANEQAAKEISNALSLS